MYLVKKHLWDILLIFLFDSWLFIFWCSKTSFSTCQKAEPIIKTPNLISFNSYHCFFQSWNFRIIFMSFYITPYIQLSNKYYQFFHYSVSHIKLYSQSTFQKPISIFHNICMNYTSIYLIVSFISIIFAPGQ